MSYLVDFLNSKRNLWNMRESHSAIIGVEIRRKRLLESVTLSKLCHMLCSPSYLCKIERNQIDANQTILSEILDRVSISGEQKNMLFNFYDVLLDSIRMFVNHDKEGIKKYVVIGTGFENYRYRILQMIYALLDHDLYRAKEIDNEIKGILSGMQDVDLLIFSIFSAILAYKDKNYQEVIDLLHAVDGLELSDELTYLRLKYMFFSSSMLGSYETQYYYDNTVSQLSRLGYYSYIEEMHYCMCLFYFKSNANRLFLKVYRLIHNPVYKNSLDFYIAYKNRDYDSLVKLKKLKLSEFGSYLVDTLSSNNAKLEVVRHLSTSLDDYDFNSYLLKYLSYHSEEEKVDYLMSIANGYRLSCDALINKFFLSELARLSIDKGHYKETVKAISLYCECL